MSKVSKTLSTSEVSRKLRERNAAQSRKQAKAKSQPVPAKKQPTPIRKPDQPAKVARNSEREKNLTLEKSPTLTAKSAMSQEERESAKGLLEECRYLVQTASTSLSALDAKIQKVRETGAWRAEYASFHAFKNSLQELSGISRASIAQIASLQLAMPEATPEERAKVPRRVAAKVARLAKKKKLTPKLKKAATEGSKEFDEAVKQEGVSDDVKSVHERDEEPIISDTSDSLLAKSETNTRPVPLRNGGSGAVEGKSGEAERYDSVIREAIEAYRTLYANANYETNATDAECLKEICGAWLNGECRRADLADMTNVQACDHLERMAKL